MAITEFRARHDVATKAIARMNTPWPFHDTKWQRIFDLLIYPAHRDYQAHLQRTAAVWAAAQEPVSVMGMEWLLNQRYDFVLRRIQVLPTATPGLFRVEIPLDLGLIGNPLAQFNAYVTSLTTAGMQHETVAV